MPSQTQLEYSRSMNQIEAETTPFGVDEEEEKHGDSKRASGIELHHPPTLLERTPQFHGSSPVILEQANESCTLEPN